MTPLSAGSTTSSVMNSPSEHIWASPIRHYNMKNLDSPTNSNSSPTAASNDMNSTESFDDNNNNNSLISSPIINESIELLNSSEKIKNKKKSPKNSKNNHNKNQNHQSFMSPNTFLKKHPYPKHYRGITPGQTTTSPGSQCSSDWVDNNTSLCESLGDLSLNNSDSEIDNENDEDDESVSSPCSVRSGKWCRSLHEKIEAAGTEEIENIPSHLSYVTSYAESWIEGESDVSEWEDSEESEESGDSDSDYE
mmetsp:Transcript_44415/g.56865  ORF Transcript_44415/g.56865 Transcript_44415/m.56865 type:complete len:250 (+) Transcript_44415:1144-1893(+)